MRLTPGGVGSVILHGVVLAFIFVDLPKASPEPEAPEAIEVELFQPEAPDPATPEEPTTPEATAEPPAATIEPAPAQSRPEREPVETAATPPLATLRAVTKFADEDAQGEESGEETVEDTPAPEDKPIETPSDAIADDQAVVPEVEQRKEQPVDETPEENAAKPANPPEPEESKEQIDEPAEIVTAPESDTNAQPVSEPESEQVFTAIARPAKPIFRPARPPRPARARPSRSANRAPVATTAKRNVARARRAGALCVTELKRRLNTAPAPRFPDILPTYRLAEGNVLQVNRGVFRERGRWTNIRFRCEIDRGATEVVSFSLTIGGAISRAEARSRGLPGA